MPSNNDSAKNVPVAANVDEGSTGECNYTEEKLQLIMKIKRSKDYYEILGLEKSCSVEEIRKAYRKLSLKVHPDKNKAPGSEEAFKKVSKAFKCLSNDDSRTKYDQAGLVEEFECNQQHKSGGEELATNFSTRILILMKYSGRSLDKQTFFGRLVIIGLGGLPINIRKILVEGGLI